MANNKFDEKRLISLILRIGLSVVFLYAGISAFLVPTSWIGFIPIWLRDIISAKLFLQIHAGWNIIIGLWLISGYKKIYAVLIAGLEIFLIIIFNIGALDIIFRDIAIMFSAIALAIMHYKEVNLK